jgi:type VI secretion system ImpB/VipA family protein
LANASVNRVPKAYAALPQRYFPWSVPSVSSTKLNASTFQVDVRFAALADFRPEAVLARVEPLRKLLEARERLAALRDAVAGAQR